MTDKLLKINTRINYTSGKDQFHSFTLEYPLSVCFKITNKCNFKCLHCIGSSNSAQELGLPTTKIKKILKKLKKNNILRVDITGGEPFIRQDLSEILYFAKSLGLELVVTTNGSLVTREHAKTLRDTKAFIQISIDGPQKINDRIRQSGSFRKAVSTIKMLKDYKVPVRINCTIQKGNLKHLSPMVQLARDLHVESLYFIIVSAQGRAEKLKSKICLNKREEQYVKSLVNDTKSKESFEIKFLDYKIFEAACVLIDTNGDIVSQRWDQKDTLLVGNIFKDSLKKVWIKPNSFDHASHLMLYLQHYTFI